MSDSAADQGRQAPLLEDIGPILVGTGDIMALVGNCWAMCWHAAHGGNLDLAAYYLRRVRSLLRRLAAIKPKYREQVADFDRDHLEGTYQALLESDLAGFRAAYERAVVQANAYHVDTGHPYIFWVLPKSPPDAGLELGPVEPG